MINLDENKSEMKEKKTSHHHKHKKSVHQGTRTKNVKTKSSTKAAQVIRIMSRGYTGL